MNALGCREAKRNVAFLQTRGMQACNGGRDDFCCLACPLPWGHQFRECLFDGHFGSQLELSDRYEEYVHKVVEVSRFGAHQIGRARFQTDFFGRR
ncbi:hypothetical protein CO610_08265 [Lysobacteraceae bacterium NML95-0200]|nr:hypothetical protein CO610_08265 [Xanthomonadaceae bacterium NML95-0200]